MSIEDKREAYHYDKDSKGEKLFDFILGFGLIIGEFFVVMVSFFFSGGILLTLIFVLIIIDIILSVRFFKKTRRFIAIGLISAGLISIVIWVLLIIYFELPFIFSGKNL